MRKFLFFLGAYLFLQSASVTHVWSTGLIEQNEKASTDVSVKYPDDFVNGWNAYIGKTVVFTQRLYLCGQYGNALYLAYERLKNPGELANVGTVEYESLKTQYQKALITASGADLDITVRQGGYVESLRAKITGEQVIELLDANQLSWIGNERPLQRPDIGDARLAVCGVNIENYFTTIGGMGAKTQEEYNRQHTKIIKALTNINADIYALAELEEGDAAILAIVNGLNQSFSTDRYAYVTDGNTDIGAYTKVGYVYRADKVTPVLDLGRPDPSRIYSKRQYVQAFDEIATNERFICSMNHFKAQSTDADGNDNTGAMRLGNAQNLTTFLSQQINSNYYNDPDILILGDLNSYTKDYTIRHLVNSGYINELEKHDAGSYSHVFKNQAGRLDHAFASSSLDYQITGAAIYSLNTDEYYKNGYESDITCSMYAFSDHNPVLVGLNLKTDPNGCIPINFQETFASSLGRFYYINMTGTNYWGINLNEECAQMSGYRNESGLNEDWLISPAFDLSGKEKATLSFDHTARYGKIENQEWAHTLWVSKNYQDKSLASTADWTQIAIPNYPTGVDYTYVSSGEIIIPKEFLVSNAYFAFKYVSPETFVDATTWRIKNVEFKSVCGPVGNIEQNQAKTLYKVYSQSGNIIIENAENESISIFNTMGKCISVGKTQLQVNRGIYFVRVNDRVYKVLVT